MMSSDIHRNAEAILREVFELLNEKHISEIIDKPIDTAVADFRFEASSPVTYTCFMDVTSRLVSHVYARGLLFRQYLTAKQAHCEAMALLEKGYQNTSARGYYAAYLDAANDLDQVLIQLIGIIKTKARDRHKRWVFATRIGASSWETKCRIVEILIRQSPFLPPGITACPPAQLTDHIDQLIKSILSSQHAVQDLLNADTGMMSA